MNEEIKKLREEFEERIKELEEKYNSEEERPEVGDKYWAISAGGKPNEFRWDGDCIDEEAFEFGNIFKTEEEAKFEAERIKVLRELGKLGSPYDDWFENWCIYLNGDGEVEYSCEIDSISVYGDYYFRSAKEAKEAVEKIGKDRIKKYLFRTVG